MKLTQEMVFKTINDVNLNLYVFEPEHHKASDCRPAIVFFFGGGWNNGVRSRQIPGFTRLPGRTAHHW